MDLTVDSPRISLPAPPEEQQRNLERGGVAVWREDLSIRSYEPEAADRFPMFLDRRVYQGSSGRVYPLPFVERVATEAIDRRWDAVHLENALIRLVILPELGGRIHIGYDKVADYDFFYRNNVIKPALVGLAGPWVSGGVEFNWPQHHRPGTFLPVETVIEREPDGAVTVWSSDHDPFARMKGMHGVRIRPDSSLIELRVRLHNRTEDTQTFLWWANVAARAHDRYQSFFPTDVHYVADHARRAVTGFPRADRPYYGVDYPSRVDEQHPDADRLDFYGNIPVPTSYMVLETEDDFFGGYDHERGAGFVHWADRRIAPGKKQWTWGNAPFGHAWDRHLTDHDGPYVELMAGVYTDNQPDFSYLAPGETKTFSQYWYPITGIGPAHQATKQAAVSLSLEGEEAAIGVAVTGIHPAVTVRLTRTVDAEGVASSAPQTVFERVTPLSPGEPLLVRVPVAGETLLSELLLSVETESEVLVRWQPRPVDHRSEEPAVATEPPLPEQIESSDELYLTGVHLQQYRHPTRSAEPYFLEILRRDPGDARANVALGAREYRRGDFDRSHEHFSTAIDRLTRRNPNPADGEAHYRLGLTLVRLGRPEAAYDAFAKAAWDVRWSHPAEVRMAVLDASAHRDEQSLGRLTAAARHDADDLRMLALRVVVLRRLGRFEESRTALERTLELDPLDVLSRTLSGDPPADALLLFDAAMDFAEFGETELALELLATAAAVPPTSAGGIAPIAEYATARILDLGDRADEASAARTRAQSASTEYCFPSGLYAYEALRAALRADPADARALALLGMWLYSADRHEDALEAWMTALETDTSDAVLMRNTAVALVNHRGDDAAAAELYRRALSISDDARLWYEYDQLAARQGVSAAERLARLESHHETATSRDDLLVEISELLVRRGRPDEALELLTSRPLQPWEGGEGRALRAYSGAALAAAVALPPIDALALAESVLTPPTSLGEAWHLLDSLADVHLAVGDARQAIGDLEGARAAWRLAVADARRATVDGSTFAGAEAALRLGDRGAAEALWTAIDEHAELLDSAVSVDYFATSLPALLLFADDAQKAAQVERRGLLTRLAEVRRSATTTKRES